MRQQTNHSLDDEYQKIEDIGQGSYGDVFKVKQKHGKRQIRAVKRISIDPLSQYSQEVQSLKKLKNDHIIEYFGYIIQNQCLYIIMRCCKGNLRDQIRAQKNFQPKKIINLLMQITSAMLCLSQTNIMHLDLKPQNILYEEVDYYKICDFGCSRLYRQVSKVSNMFNSPKKSTSNIPIILNEPDQPIFGTPQYIAPQIQLDHNQIPRSSCDVWSMGIILYELVYHKHPFKLNYQGRVESQDFKHFKQGKLIIDFPQKSQKYPIQLIKQMLNPNQFDRMSWSKIRNYLIQKYRKQEAEFMNLQQAANNQVNLSVIFANIAFTIDNYLTQQFDEFRENNMDELLNLKKILIKLGYGLLVKFYRLFCYKIKFKLNPNTRASLQFMYENIKEQFIQLKSSENFDDDNQIKKLEIQLCTKLHKLNNLITYQKKQKWQSIYRLSCFADEAVQIKNFFCAGDKFKNTCQLYEIRTQD